MADGCDQVVLLAAGLDTRAFRLAWPGPVRLYELDLPEVLTFKNEVLARVGATPRCERTVIPADLREDWHAELAKTSFGPARPTAWLIEGLMLYLTAAQAESLLLAVSELSPPGSRLSFEHSQMAANDLLSQARTMPAMSKYTRLWKGGLGGDAPAWLDRHRWQPELHELATVAASYGRDIPGTATGGFVTAVRVSEEPARATDVPHVGRSPGRQR